MPSSLNGTGVTFNDGTTLQSGNIPAANLGSGTANSNTFLRGDRTFATVPPTPPQIEILNTQIFTASGTWTKPAVSANDTLIIAVIGGGGSGGAARAFTGSNIPVTAAGGGGGGVGLFSLRIGDLPTTLSVTVGAGGGVRTNNATSGQNGTNGLAGGASLFGGARASGGGGGQASGGDPAFRVGGNGGGIDLFIGNATGFTQAINGGRGRNGRSNTTVEPIPAGLTGGGGGAGKEGSTLRSQNYPSGTGRLFGNGGSGGGNTAVIGVIPGGGGGGACGTGFTTSGAGARGEVRCFVVRGRFSASAFFGID